MRTRFSNFSDDELNTLEDACYQVGARWLVEEIRLERRLRESNYSNAL